MVLTQQEQIQIKTDVEILKSSTAQVLEAIGRGTEAQTKNTEAMASLVVEMKERDVRDEYSAREIAEVKGFIGRVDKEQREYAETHRDSLKRLKGAQDNVDAFKKSVTSSWGKIAAMIIAAAIAYGLGVDLSVFSKDN